MFVKIIPPTLTGGQYHKALRCETGVAANAVLNAGEAEDEKSSLDREYRGGNRSGDR
jgi:hypothetical protein